MPHARPTTDRAKESLFNILNQHFYFEDCNVLDLYAGLGSIALEFASRESKVVAVDRNYKSVKYIKDVSTSLEADVKTVKGDALQFVKRTTDSFDIIFVDPPYANIADLDKLVQLVQGNGVLKSQGWLIIEHISSFKFSDNACFDVRDYGQSTFSFFKFD